MLIVFATAPKPRPTRATTCSTSAIVGVASPSAAAAEARSSSPSHRRAAAADCRYDDDKAVAHVQELIEKMPDAASDVLKACRHVKLPDKVISKLAKEIAVRCRKPWSSLQTAPDLILIDGRFRVACALEAARRRTLKGATIAIHDFQRRHYQIARLFLKRVEMVERLAIFRRRTMISSFLIDLALKAYRCDPK